jgi:hypothetical protein
VWDGAGSGESEGAAAALTTGCSFHGAHSARGYNDYGRAEPIPCHAIACMPRPDVVPAALQSASREGERGESASASARSVREE